MQIFSPKSGCHWFRKNFFSVNRVTLHALGCNKVFHRKNPYELTIPSGIFDSVNYICSTPDTMKSLNVRTPGDRL